MPGSEHLCASPGCKHRAVYFRVPEGVKSWLTGTKNRLPWRWIEFTGYCKHHTPRTFPHRTVQATPEEIDRLCELKLLAEVHES